MKESLKTPISSSDDEEMFNEEKANPSDFSNSTKYREHLAEKRAKMREARKMKEVNKIPLRPF